MDPITINKNMFSGLFLWKQQALNGHFEFKKKPLFFCAKGDVIKVNKAFRGRVTLPGYAANPLNGTMEISSLRTNDSGTYHCQIVVDNDYERDTVPLVVSGKSSSSSSEKAYRKRSSRAADRPRSCGTLISRLWLNWFLCFISFQACCANVTQIMATSEQPPFQLIKLMKH